MSTKGSTQEGQRENIAKLQIEWNEKNNRTVKCKCGTTYKRKLPIQCQVCFLTSIKRRV